MICTSLLFTSLYERGNTAYSRTNVYHNKLNVISFQMPCQNATCRTTYDNYNNNVDIARSRVVASVGYIIDGEREDC